MEIEDYIVASDQQLIELTLGSDAVAFEYLINRYKDSIYQLYMQRTAGNSDDAKDLVQEACIKVYLNLHKYNFSYTFGQWMYTIAKNTFVDYVRKRRDDLSIDKITSAQENSINTPAITPTPEESIINSQQRAELDQLMAKMPDKYKILIEMRFFKEFSYEEIAEEMGMPMGTVKTQIHRAREMLCKAIRLHQLI